MRTSPSGLFQDQNRRRRVAILIACGAVVVVAAVVIPLALTGSRSSTTPTVPTTNARTPSCGSSGCGVVNTVRASPRVTVFYGASCTGIYGAWFLNIVEEGPNDSLRPASSLRWTFPNGVRLARPDGTVTVASSTGPAVSMTLQQGVLTLHGTGSDNATVTGVGTLLVRLTGTASAPSLTLVESGLEGAEQSLGLLSPFHTSGRSVTVPVKLRPRFTGC
jgi:hypothetical protein